VLVPIGVLGAHAPRRNWGTLKGTPAACWYAPRHTAVGTSSLPWLMKWRSEAGLRSFAVGMSRKLLAEVKPIFSLVAYRRIAEFPDNQTKRADNSYEDRRHKSRCSGREFTITRTKLGNRHQHQRFHMTYSFSRNLVCAFHASENGCRLLRLTAFCD